MSEKIIIEDKVELTREDGGAALIGEPMAVEGKENLYVRVCSFDDDYFEGETDTPRHDLIKKLEGKKLRITIEMLD